MASSLSRTPSGAGNQRTWTYSGWFKLCTTDQNIFLLSAGAYGDSKSMQLLIANSGNFLQFQGFSSGGSADFNCETNAELRDTNAWYHIMVACDTTQATASDRAKIYINGELQTLRTSTYPSQNYDTGVNTTIAHEINDRPGATLEQPLYATHVHMTDGTTYAPTVFGETDSTSGIWKPKTAPSVTYGTNGFFLKMENSGAMGTDSSGNSNTFTVNGTITQAVDTPSNVFAVMNPLAMGTASSGLTFSNGNLTSTNSSSGHRSVLSTLAVSTGKWYYEGKSVTTGGAYPTFGIFNIDAAFDAGTFFTSTANGYGYNSNGHIYHNNGSLITGLSTWTDGDIIGIALDATNDKLYISKNGSWQNSGDPSNNTGGISITSDITWCFAAHLNDAGTNPVQNYNFGNGYFGTTAVASANADANGFGAFEYAVPTGFYTLCTKNIKEFG